MTVRTLDLDAVREALGIAREFVASAHGHTDGDVYAQIADALEQVQECEGGIGATYAEARLAVARREAHVQSVLHFPKEYESLAEVTRLKYYAAVDAIALTIGRDETLAGSVVWLPHDKTEALKVVGYWLSELRRLVDECEAQKG